MFDAEALDRRGTKEPFNHSSRNGANRSKHPNRITSVAAAIAEQPRPCPVCRIAGRAVAQPTCRHPASQLQPKPPKTPLIQPILSGHPEETRLPNCQTFRERQIPASFTKSFDNSITQPPLRGVRPNRRSVHSGETVREAWTCKEKSVWNLVRRRLSITKPVVRCRGGVTSSANWLSEFNLQDVPSKT